MIRSLLSFAAVASLICQFSVFAAPTPSPDWLAEDCGCTGKYPPCGPGNIRTRVNFESMAPEERKAYTDAILCLMDQPSSLDPAVYPAAVNRYFDYAVIHVLRTGMVHLSGYFSTWHRYFLWLFEEDLRQTCGYTGSFPYWNFAETANDIHHNAVFDGSAYSMSGDGLFNDTGPIILGPALTIPHGTGGGCVTSGPFASLNTTIAFIDPSILLTGAALPATTFDLAEKCLTRDLNQYVSQMYTNMDQLIAASHAANASDFEYQLNGVIGGSSLGIHSGAHFSVGGPMNSIHVSPQDPIWYPLHTMIDLVYTSWQINNPELALTLNGTMTALNIPPSDEVTLNSVEPDFGYFALEPIMVGELISTTSGPFCYQYDVLIS